MTKHKVVLVFDTELEKDYFLGQLSDGWGENEVYLDWPENVEMADAEEIHVENCGENWEYNKMRAARTAARLAEKKNERFDK
jgi:hypothetical protein